MRYLVTILTDDIPNYPWWLREEDYYSVHNLPDVQILTVTPFEE